jgi:multidrug efflux pump subunit AcrA (membrane-fusion protein)
VIRFVRGFLSAGLLIAATVALAGCGDQKVNQFPVYMEADLVLIGSEQGGRVATLAIEKGEIVEKGTLLFTSPTSRRSCGAPVRSRCSALSGRTAAARQRP